MSESINITHHNKIETLTGTINTLAQNIQQGKVDLLHRAFKEDPISGIKTNDHKGKISPALKKTINILKDLIIEIDMLNQNTTRELWAVAKSVNNSSNSNFGVVNGAKLSGSNGTVEAYYPEVTINTQIKEIKAMIDQFSSGYMAKKQTVGTFHGTSLQLEKNNH